MDDRKKTADYEIIRKRGGNVYRFFCDLSGAVCVETSLYKSADSEKELMNAWEKEGRKHFNMCHKCGRWVSDIMYNPDVLNCIRCSPIEDFPEFCPKCGEKAEGSGIFCHKCGSRLMYGDGCDVDDC